MVGVSVRVLVEMVVQVVVVQGRRTTKLGGVVLLDRVMMVVKGYISGV